MDGRLLPAMHQAKCISSGSSKQTKQSLQSGIQRSSFCTSRSQQRIPKFTTVPLLRARIFHSTSMGLRLQKAYESFGMIDEYAISSEFGDSGRFRTLSIFPFCDVAIAKIPHDNRASKTRIQTRSSPSMLLIGSDGICSGWITNHFVGDMAAPSMPLLPHPDILRERLVSFISSVDHCRLCNRRSAARTVSLNPARLPLLAALVG